MATQTDTYQQLDERFKTSHDRWNLETSVHEKKRLQALFAFCKSVPHRSILEIGCAEGHFTKMLTTISNDVTAIDLSPVAISRAKKRAPQATYVVTTLEDFYPTKKFDLIVASEVLYYMPDKKESLSHLRRLGEMVLTSTFLMRNYRGYVSEWYLARLRRVHTKVLLTFEEKKLTLVTLWKILNYAFFALHLHFRRQLGLPPFSHFH